MKTQLRLPLFLSALAVAGGVLLSCTGGAPSIIGKASDFTSNKLQITQAFIPAGQNGRTLRSMNPDYITIHSTQNTGRGADARTHARLIQRGGLKSKHNSTGFLTWHFTVDDHSIYQSLPTNEQGQHADYEGTGNRKSIGIEMCENAGNSRSATVDRTARLTAELLKRYNIPLSHVVPHQHWRMIRYSDKRDLGHKNCPHFLMDNGKPGAKWQGFLNQVKSHLYGQSI